MCVWFWGYHPIIFINFFHLSFPGPISIRIDSLCVQFLLEFSAGHFETAQICSTKFEDMRVVLGLSSYYSLSTLHFFGQTDPSIQY